MFPAGLPGLALLLLRLSVARALLFDEGCSAGMGARGCNADFARSIRGIPHADRRGGGARAPRVRWLAVGAGMDCAAQAIGFSLDALALALLGPGAYSLDSRRFDAAS